MEYPTRKVSILADENGSDLIHELRSQPAFCVGTVVRYSNDFCEVTGVIDGYQYYSKYEALQEGVEEGWVYHFTGCSIDDMYDIPWYSKGAAPSFYFRVADVDGNIERVMVDDKGVEVPNSSGSISFEDYEVV